MNREAHIAAFRAQVDLAALVGDALDDFHVKSRWTARTAFRL
jgi:hypothetical protein